MSTSFTSVHKREKMLDHGVWIILVHSFEEPTEVITKRGEAWGWLNELDHPP